MKPRELDKARSTSLGYACSGKEETQLRLLFASDPTLPTHGSPDLSLLLSVCLYLTGVGVDRLPLALRDVCATPQQNTPLAAVESPVSRPAETCWHTVVLAGNKAVKIPAVIRESELIHGCHPQETTCLSFFRSLPSLSLCALSLPSISCAPIKSSPRKAGGRGLSVWWPVGPAREAARRRRRTGPAAGRATWAAKGR